MEIKVSHLLKVIKSAVPETGEKRQAALVQLLIKNGV